MIFWRDKRDWFELARDYFFAVFSCFMNWSAVVARDGREDVGVQFARHSDLINGRKYFVFYKKYKNQIGTRSAQPVEISLTRTAVVADACSTKRRYFVKFLARIVTPMDIRKICRVVSLERHPRLCKKSSLSSVLVIVIVRALLMLHVWSCCKRHSGQGIPWFPKSSLCLLLAWRPA